MSGGGGGDWKSGGWLKKWEVKKCEGGVDKYLIWSLCFDSIFLNFYYFVRVFNFRSNENKILFSEFENLKVRLEIERLMISIYSKQAALSHFYVEREFISVLCLPALCNLWRDRMIAIHYSPN